jgi:protein phosphatase 1L
MEIQGGSTALFGIISQNKLYLTNVGDSKAILVRDNQAIPLTTDHTAANEEEKKTIESRGGFIFEKQLSGGIRRKLVQGALEVTRSIGDPSYKKYISCEPDISEYEFTPEDQYLILATDGLWKVKIFRDFR